MSVAVTDSDSRWPSRRLLPMRCQGIRAAHDAFQLLRLHDAAQAAPAVDLFDVAAAQQRRGRAHELLRAERDRLFEDEVLPAFDEHAPLLVGDVGGRREEARVDRAHRRAAHDVELHLAAQVAGQVLADVAHDARLVGATGAASREHERHTGTVAAVLGTRRRAHPILTRVMRGPLVAKPIHLTGDGRG
jgi:hypothetical protein